MSVSQIQPALLRRMTVRKVLECLQEQGPLSRADLTRETGISAPTVSKAVSDLLDTGLLEEGDAPENALGRPGRRLMLARERAQVIGVTLDAVECGVVCASLDGEIHSDSTVTFSTPSSYATLLEHLLNAVTQIIASTTATTLGIGVSAPGLLAEAKCLLSPNLPAINGQSPAVDLAQATGVPCFAMQEIRALCMAERLYGMARGLDDFAMIDSTFGLGLGVFGGGDLLNGHSGLAGELGHITVDPAGKLCGCGNHGCLETLSTDSALAAMVSERLGQRLTMDQVIGQLRQGQLQAPEEVNRVSEYLAIALAATINLYNPSTVFVHNRLFSISEGTMQQVIRMARCRSLDPSFDGCRILAATATKSQGAIAAVVHQLTRAAGPRVAE
ncbi:MAG: ROK family transcriptional regulator [Planctomycetaceae bacterium]